MYFPKAQDAGLGSWAECLGCPAGGKGLNHVHAFGMLVTALRLHPKVPSPSLGLVFHTDICFHVTAPLAVSSGRECTACPTGCPWAPSILRLLPPWSLLTNCPLSPTLPPGGLQTLNHVMGNGWCRSFLRTKDQSRNRNPSWDLQEEKASNLVG